MINYPGDFTQFLILSDLCSNRFGGEKIACIRKGTCHIWFRLQQFNTPSIPAPGHNECGGYKCHCGRIYCVSYRVWILLNSILAAQGCDLTVFVFLRNNLMPTKDGDEWGRGKWKGFLTGVRTRRFALLPKIFKIRDNSVLLRGILLYLRAIDRLDCFN